MRNIKVKSGTSNYRLRGDDNKVLGVLTITYKGNSCEIDVIEAGSSITSLSIGVANAQ